MLIVMEGSSECEIFCLKIQGFFASVVIALTLCIWQQLVKFFGVAVYQVESSILLRIDLLADSQHL